MPKLLFRVFAFNDLSVQFFVRARQFRGSFFNFSFELIPCLPQLALALAQAIFITFASGTPRTNYQRREEKRDRGRDVTHAKFKCEERFGEEEVDRQCRQQDSEQSWSRAAKPRR